MNNIMNDKSRMGDEEIQEWMNTPTGRKKEETRNSKVLASFEEYCAAHKNERFWQALRNWSGFGFILAVPICKNIEEARKLIDFRDKSEGWIDTFYWEEKDK